MKKIIAFLLALLLLTGCSANQNETPEAPAPSENTAGAASETEGLDVPMTEEEAAAAEAAKAAELEERAKTKALPLGSFTAYTITGETRDESVFANADMTIVNIWATYCEPCKEEMPILAELHKEMAGEVQVLGVVVDVMDEEDMPVESQVELALDLADAAGCTYDNLVLNTALAELGFGAVSAVPATMFIDKDGNTIGQGFYGALDEEGWREVIDERLEIARSRYE